ncbi:MAG: hypothetical protein IT416_01520 [Candidatus Pacebacteria bacterium]|nr:hypothetical protein [Candidatus Paceibacterota bacterium]
MRKQNKLNFSLFVGLWTTLRLIIVTTIWIWHPLWGALLNIIIDGVDGHLFESLGVKRTTYEVYDKWLDLWFYFALFIYTIQHLQTSPLYWLLIILFIVRLLGILIFTKTNQEALLFAFPNLFEPVFLVVVGWPELFNSYGYVKVLVVIFIIKMFIEWWIHLAKFDLTSLILGKPTRWFKKS